VVQGFAKAVHEVEVKRGPRNMTFGLFYGKLNDVKIDPRWWAWKFNIPFLLTIPNIC
jgi:hypothetical protein